MLGSYKVEMSRTEGGVNYDFPNLPKSPERRQNWGERPHLSLYNHGLKGFLSRERSKVAGGLDRIKKLVQGPARGSAQDTFALASVCLLISP